MRISFFLFSVLFLFNISSKCSFAQVTGTVNYRLTINDGATPKPRELNSVLYFQSGESIEIPLTLHRERKEEIVSETESNAIIMTDKPSFLLKDFSKKSIKLSDYIGFKNYLISDSIPIFQWKISNQRKKILNLPCRKATTSFRGRHYEAWYAETVAISNGPWKFSGLPGLIVSVSDIEKKYIFEMTGIDLQAKFDTVIIKLPKAYARDKLLTHAQFMALYRKKVEDNKKRARVVESSSDGISASVSFSLPGKIELY